MGVWAREGVIEIGLWRVGGLEAVGFFLEIFFRGGLVPGRLSWFGRVGCGWGVCRQVPGVC